jgi:hypothetical protein
MATTETTLTTSYQLIGAGPGVVTLELGKVAMLHIATSLPGAGAPAHRLVRGSDKESLTYLGSENIYGRKTDPTSERVVKVAYTGN